MWNVAHAVGPYKTTSMNIIKSKMVNLWNITQPGKMFTTQQNNETQEEIKGIKLCCKAYIGINSIFSLC